MVIENRVRGKRRVVLVMKRRGPSRLMGMAAPVVVLREHMEWQILQRDEAEAQDEQRRRAWTCARQPAIGSTRECHERMLGGRPNHGQ